MAGRSITELEIRKRGKTPKPEYLALAEEVKKLNPGEFVLAWTPIRKNFPSDAARVKEALSIQKKVLSVISRLIGPDHPYSVNRTMQDEVVVVYPAESED